MVNQNTLLQQATVQQQAALTQIKLQNADLKKQQHEMFTTAHRRTVVPSAYEFLRRVHETAMQAFELLAISKSNKPIVFVSDVNSIPGLCFNINSVYSSCLSIEKGSMHEAGLTAYKLIADFFFLADMGEKLRLTNRSTFCDLEVCEIVMTILDTYEVKQSSWGSEKKWRKAIEALSRICGSARGSATTKFDPTLLVKT
eukprot:CAMPEP_0174259660 /NCGR_PEP_ID=MMETSP0439-20130205/8468_1 /TAXON_ID=0 /ORGANISM="Stereomyxa ramosa, Strain Chinc5" /LENGTH=198 /DNA_ID=CAMNT_0015343643 /DNA_START=33 /DNA_END=629 /DNA_ORIENTATION=+